MLDAPSAGSQVNDPMDEPIRRLIELNRQGGRVPEGLRAAASEYSSHRTRRAFLRLADRIEAGGTPDGYSSSDLQTLIAITAIDGLNGAAEGNLSPLSDLPEDASMMAPRLVSWAESQRAVQRAFSVIESHLFFAVILLFLGGLANWLMVYLTQRPFMDLIDEYELDIDSTSLMYFQFLSWVGPSVMCIAGLAALLLLMYRFGPFHEAAELVIYALPFFGKALKRLHLAVMCDGISRFLAAGLPYPQALRGTGQLVRSKLLRQWLSNASNAVEQGGSLVEAVKYLPDHGEVLVALVGPIGPSANEPSVGWRMAADYFRSAGVRGSGSVRFLVPVFSVLGTSLGWMGMTGILMPLVSLISSLGGM